MWKKFLHLPAFVCLASFVSITYILITEGEAYVAFGYFITLISGFVTYHKYKQETK